MMDRRNLAMLLAAFVVLASATTMVSATAVPPSGGSVAPTGSGSGSSLPIPNNSYLQFTSWIPTIFAAILLAFSLTSLYYLIGVALNNLRVKNMAIAEFWQAAGTAVMVVVILWVLSVFGATLTSTKTLLVSPTAISSICSANTLVHSQFDFANSGPEAFEASTGSTMQSPTYIVCQLVEKAAKNNDPTTNIDYGLAAAYVISANMTNQTLANLDALYFFEGTAGWLRTVHSITTICLGDPIYEDNPLVGAAQCANPLSGSESYKVQYQYEPFVAYYYQRLALPPIEITASLIFYLFFLQMTGTLIMLYWWPYLLAAGILLRTFAVTRRSGGLIIALVLASLLIYPIIYLFEYTSLSNENGLCQYNSKGLTSTLTPAPATTGTPGSNCIQLIGTNSLPSMAINELPLSPPGTSIAELKTCNGGNGVEVDEPGLGTTCVVFCNLATDTVQEPSSGSPNCVPIGSTLSPCEINGEAGLYIGGYTCVPVQTNVPGSATSSTYAEGTNVLVSSLASCNGGNGLEITVPNWDNPVCMKLVNGKSAIETINPVTGGPITSMLLTEWESNAGTSSATITPCEIEGKAGLYDTANQCFIVIVAGSNPTPVNSGGGTGATTPLPIVQYQVNFFHFPNLAWVLNYHGCYPTNGDLIGWEFYYASNYLIPLNGALRGLHGVSGIFSFFFGQLSSNQASTTIPQFGTGIGWGDWSCFEPQNFASATEELFNVYGVMAVTGFILPMLNVLIALSAILGISGMLGGDTNIVGIARFI